MIILFYLVSSSQCMSAELLHIMNLSLPTYKQVVSETALIMENLVYTSLINFIGSFHFI